MFMPNLYATDQVNEEGIITRVINHVSSFFLNFFPTSYPPKNNEKQNSYNNDTCTSLKLCDYQDLNVTVDPRPNLANGGILDLHDITISADPLSEQTCPTKRKTLHTLRQKKKNKHSNESIESVEVFLKADGLFNKWKEDIVGGNRAFALCAIKKPKQGQMALLYEQFGYGSCMKKTKNPLELAVKLYKECAELKGELESLFIPL